MTSSTLENGTCAELASSTPWVDEDTADDLREEIRAVMGGLVRTGDDARKLFAVVKKCFDESGMADRPVGVDALPFMLTHWESPEGAGVEEHTYWDAIYQLCRDLCDELHRCRVNGFPDTDSLITEAILVVSAIECAAM